MELESLKVIKHTTVPWNVGVQDQFHSESYSYQDYTNKNRAAWLKTNRLFGKTN